jgi:hypothetical protein
MAKIRKIRANRPCLCGSWKTWGECCGKDLEKPVYTTSPIKRTNNPTHHFFIVNETMTEAVKDDGKILVWTNRDKALAWGHRNKERCFKTFGVIGMGDEKWVMFQMENEFRIVE